MTAEVIKQGVERDLADIKGLLDELVMGGVLKQDGRHVTAYEGLEAFCAIALKVIEKTPPEAIQAAALAYAEEQSR